MPLAAGFRLGPYEITGLGDKEEAIKWLETSYQDRIYMLTMKVSPEFDFIRTEPQYLALLKQLRLDR